MRYSPKRIEDKNKDSETNLSFEVDLSHSNEWIFVEFLTGCFVAEIIENRLKFKVLFSQCFYILLRQVVIFLVLGNLR
jgi:hypothetical protein